MTCAELGPDLVAHALGQCSAEEAGQVETHVAACAACRTELVATRALLGAGRAAPQPGRSAQDQAAGEARLLTAFREETSGSHAPRDVPQPAAPRRRTARILAMLVPVAAAATLLVAVLATSRDKPVLVLEGEGILRPDEGRMRSAPDVVVRSEFAFGCGDELRAAAAPVTVRLTLRPGAETSPAEKGRPAPGLVELKLLPGACVRRNETNAVELSAGMVELAAGPLAEPFRIDAGPCSAAIRGTRLTATVTAARLVVIVREGLVELARAGAQPLTLRAGEQGLADTTRMLKGPADARTNGDAFLAPRVELVAGPAPLAFEARLSPGPGGPVAIPAFEDHEPRFLLHVLDAAGCVREIKLLRTMVTSLPPAGSREGTWSLTSGAPCRLGFSLAGIELPPGACEATIRYMSYRPRADAWLGVVESDPLAFEVPAK